MLGYMEQAQVFNSINFSVLGPGAALAWNSTAYYTKINNFLCPSDANAGTGNSNLGQPNINSYCASYGTTSNQYSSTSTGLFAYVPATAFATVSTAPRTRRLTAKCSWATPRTRRPSGPTASCPRRESSPTPIARRSPLRFSSPTSRPVPRPIRPPTPTMNNSIGALWYVGTMGDTMFNTVVPPNSTQYRFGGCKNSGGGWAEGMAYIIASSNHSGGCNFLMADGSVKFIKNSVTRQIIWGPAPAPVAKSSAPTSSEPSAFSIATLPGATSSGRFAPQWRFPNGRVRREWRFLLKGRRGGWIEKWPQGIRSVPTIRNDSRPRELAKSSRTCPRRFLGMDPYLDLPDIWPDFHHAFAVELSKKLNQALPAPHYSRLGTRRELGIIEEPESQSDGSQSIEITLHDEMVRHHIVEIRDSLRGHKLVTLIEILSPSNKRPGPDRVAYRLKQQEVLESDASLVEIDLLRR